MMILKFLLINKLNNFRFDNRNDSINNDFDEYNIIFLIINLHTEVIFLIADLDEPKGIG